MAETRERDPLGSSSESESDDRARQERRDRREKVKNVIVDETLLDVTDGEDHGEETDEVQSCADRLRKIHTGGDNDGSAFYSQIKKPNVPFSLKKPKASPSGAGSLAHSSRKTRASLNGAPTVQENTESPSGSVPEKAIQIGAIPEALVNNGTYQSVCSLRKGMKTNPNLRGGVRAEKSNLGNFANPGDDRINFCHIRSIVEKKQNISMSFDPATMMCYSCTEKGGHPVCLDEEGGEGNASS